MDHQHVSAGGDGQPQVDSTSSSSSAPPRRRLSMDEDFFYQRIMPCSTAATATARRPSQPPPYDLRPTLTKSSSSSSLRHDLEPSSSVGSSCAIEDEDEALPDYSNSLVLEGIFVKKHEIENTTKRAEDRRWHNAFVELNGTALNVYTVKKDWGWGRSRDGPSICPDNPPWMKKAKLEKSYSLLHADAGIAADYRKRRYVIRIRAETDQFLLSCIEISTFVKWLQALFAAIDVAAPIDEREFPRDMSIPRVQRIRWYRGQNPTAGVAVDGDTQQSEEVSAPDNAAPESSRRPSVASTMATTNVPPPEADHSSDSDSDAASAIGPRLAPRISNTNYPNNAVDPFSGKWLPDHTWSEAHDMIYAKLCYSNLLFRSPRKSNYIISKGKQWFVDWTTGKMVRVLPPSYDENDFFGPWQVIHTENMRI